MSIPGNEVHLAAEEGGMLIRRLRDELRAKEAELGELRELSKSYLLEISRLKTELEQRPLRSSVATMR